MNETYQDMEPGYLNLHQHPVSDPNATHNYVIKFDDDDEEIIGTIYNNNKLVIELNPKGLNQSPEITFRSKTGKKFSLGLKSITK